MAKTVEIVQVEGKEAVINIKFDPTKTYAQMVRDATKDLQELLRKASNDPNNPLEARRISSIDMMLKPTLRCDASDAEIDAFLATVRKEMVDARAAMQEFNDIAAKAAQH